MIKDMGLHFNVRNDKEVSQASITSSQDATISSLPSACAS